MRVSQTVGLIAIMAIGISSKGEAQGARSGPQTQKPTVAPRLQATQVKPVASTWTAKTPWGDPDLQAIWNDATETPLQRNPKYGMRETLTDEEYAEAEKAAMTLQQRAIGLVAPEVGKPLRRTSLIIDPPDGRLPPLTPAAREEMAERQRLEKEPRFDSSLWKNFHVRTRCIARGVPAIMHPTCYNNNYQIIQAPGYVVILSEMIHDARMIVLDGRPHLDAAIKQWGGDARGHWEGQTLVVESTNFHPDSEPMVTASLRGGEAKVIERFTRTSATDLEYRYTLEAPSIYTKPITAFIPMSTIGAADRIMEYACIEGDRSMALSIRGMFAQKKSTTSPTPSGGGTPVQPGNPR